MRVRRRATILTASTGGGGGGGGGGLTPTLWVDAATGDDSRSKATVAASNGTLPWATIGRAAWGSTSRSSPNTSEAAAAGDVVLVAAGTYSVAAVGTTQTDGTARWEVAYGPANSGTAGNLITFYCTGAVTLSVSSGYGPVIGAHSKNYIRWQGPFSINHSGVPDTGPVILSDTIGSEIIGLTINAAGDPAWGDNHTGIRIEGGTSCTVRNCTISNALITGINGNNGAGIQFYQSTDCTIENNNVSGCGSGIFIKGPDTARSSGIIIRNNFVDNCTNGIILSGATGALVYRNLVTDCSEGGILLWQLNSPGGGNTAWPVSSDVFNNTIARCFTGLYYKTSTDSTSLRWTNNIVYSCTNAWLSDVTSTPVGVFTTSDRNDCNVSGSFSALTSGRTLAQHQTDFSLELNSITTDPSFVSAGTDNFHLTGGSAALTLGRVVNSIGGTNGDTIPAGCYITGSETIGVS